MFSISFFHIQFSEKCFCTLLFKVLNLDPKADGLYLNTDFGTVGCPIFFCGSPEAVVMTLSA